MMTANEMFFCFRIDFIQPDTVVVVDVGKFEERDERRRSWRIVGGRTMDSEKQETRTRFAECRQIAGHR